MRRFTSVAAILLVLVLALPALACNAAPRATRIQRNCCTPMGSNCGDTAKLGCCELQPGGNPAQIPVQVALPSLATNSVAFLHPVPVERAALTGHLWQLQDDHSPPGLLVAATTVLRI